MLLTCEDVEKTLQLSHFTIEYAPDGVFWVDSESRIHRVNEAACRLLGYTEEELLRRKMYELPPKETEETWRKRWVTLKEQKTVTIEKFQPTRNGRLILLEMTQNFIEVEGREYSCNFVRDVTERQEAEERLQEVRVAVEEKLQETQSERQQVQEQLHESQRMLWTLIKNLPGTVYRCCNDERLTFDFISDWCQEMTGYDPSELSRSKRIAMVDVIHPQEREKVLKYVKKVLQAQKPGHLTHRILTASGEVKWVLNRFRDVYTDGGEVAAIEGFFADMTERIQAENALSQALSEVEHLKNRLEEENIYLRQEIRSSYNFGNIISRSELFQQVLGQIEQVAGTDATVLIVGETGTGKELVARAVHSRSGRKERPLVKVNCAALPSNLIESELFGHEKGAFTGAIARKIGRFELAHRGTIFLDEIGELPMELQVKLLRVLQEGEFDRLGNPNTIHVDVRVIAATNRDLEKAVEDGSFREDLYYRLNVFPIRVPPLRERQEDVPLLVEHFVQTFSKKAGKPIEKIPRKVMDILQDYHWPGNVRELENIIERAVILSQGTRLELGNWFSRKEGTLHQEKLATLEDVERDHITKVLKATKWKVSGKHGAADILGMNPQTLFSRMKKLKIQRPT